MRHYLRFVVAALCLFAALATPLPRVDFYESMTSRAQVRPIYSLGASGLGQALRRLQTTASALHTGAHPDDEDSALIARLARNEQARVAYLSLNRGEGGQNIIGSELFEPLGVIRTEELLQARRLDGGDQFFTRTFDYGFSKTRDEAAEKWGERRVLGDMVRVIRMYRPLIIWSRFSGTPADGHGQHQLAGYLTPLAFRAAADPQQFPEHMAEGLQPWQALKLYVGEGFRQNMNSKLPPLLRVETGSLDPLIGRSYFEIAMEGRSQHKSQEMGMLEARGPQSSGVRLLESKVKTDATNEAEKSVFDGIDTSIKGIAALAALPDKSIQDELGEIQTAAERALATYNPMSPAAVIPSLVEGIKFVRQARGKLGEGSVEAKAKATADFLLARKETEFVDALQRAAGVEIDVLSDDETVAPSESINVSVKVFVPPAMTEVVRAGEASLRAPDNWTVTALATEPPRPATPWYRPQDKPQQTNYFRVALSADAVPTEPYWMSAPRDGYVFRWPDDTSARGRAFAPALVTGDVKMDIGGAQVTISKPAQYRYADDIRGELRRDLNVVPALGVALDAQLFVAPLDRLPLRQRVAVRVTDNAQGPVAGEVKLNLPDGWSATPVAASPRFAFKRKGERTSIAFDVTIPAKTKPGGYMIGAQASADGGTAGNNKIYDRETRTLAYSHIQTHRYYTPATATARVLNLKVPQGVSVGYVMGSGDEVPEAIKRMGLQVTMLDEGELSTGDLSRFGALVVGIRASEVRPDFVANNARLLDYAQAGGTLIVQYQRPDYVTLNLAPYPAAMAARTTDETAAVTILQPQHPVFNYPNAITNDDWKDWVQERNLYGLTTFDARYVPLLESHDPGEEPQRGGEVYAQLGRGHYVYTSYAWFRQLPSGVPGAYRLFANLLGLAKKPVANPKESRVR